MLNNHCHRVTAQLQLNKYYYYYYYYFPGVRILKADVSEHSVSSIFTYPPVKMEPTECSETPAFNFQMPGKYPEENIPYLQHGESLKTTIIPSQIQGLLF
jgi:hypothetical protein